MKWTSVHDELPSFNENIGCFSRYVLIWDCNENDVYMAYYQKVGKFKGKWVYSASGDVWDENEVSYWMELPEPPKGIE